MAADASEIVTRRRWLPCGQPGEHRVLLGGCRLFFVRRRHLAGDQILKGQVAIEVRALERRAQIQIALFPVLIVTTETVVLEERGSRLD